MLRTLTSVILCASALALAGCYSARPWPGLPASQTPTRPVAARPAEPVGPPPLASPGDEVAFYDLTEAHGLDVSIDMVTGRRVCRDGANEVIVMPSARAVTINGIEHALAGPIRWRQGVLYLPGEARALLAQHLRSRPIPEVAHDPDRFDGREMHLHGGQPAARTVPAAAKRAPAAQPLPTAWRVESRRPWRYIVIHHSATDQGGAASFHREHAKKWPNGLGYHFVIGNGTTTGDGEVEVGTRWLRQAEGIDGAHAGNERYNKHGIGICLVGDFDGGRPSPAQLVALRQLCRALMQRYGISRDRVYPHRDVRHGTTHCPGTGFPFDEFLRSLQ